jgi:hypothetical protein
LIDCVAETVAALFEVLGSVAQAASQSAIQIGVSMRSRFGRARLRASIKLISLVGAGRFERPTPCAQGGVRYKREHTRYQLLTIQAVARSVLKLVVSN